MKTSLKVFVAAVGIAVGALGVMTSAASAQQIRGSVYGPYYNPHYMSNGTGSVPDSNRDPHNDR